MLCERCLKILLISTFLSISTICASSVDIVEKDGNKNTSNEIDDSYKEQKGWSFYFDEKYINNNKKNAKRDKLIKKAELDLLQKILDENRKQTKIQEKILSLLQKQIDPKPRVITVNSKKCVANSDADCFDFASLLKPEAKRVPVMAEFLKDPYNIEKAARYLQWQAKYFTHIINVGNALQMAYQQFGEKAYPIGAQSPQYTVGYGAYEGSILPAAQTRLIISNRDKLSFDIFIGKNINMDIYSALSIKDILEKYKDMDISLIFWDNKSKDVFIGALSSVYKIDKLPYFNKVKKIVDPSMFKEFGVEATPSFVAKLNTKDKKVAQIILHGKADLTSFRSQTIAFMELHKMIDYTKFTEQNNWESKEGAKAVKRLYKSTHGVDIKIK